VLASPSRFANHCAFERWILDGWRGIRLDERTSDESRKSAHGLSSCLLRPRRAAHATPDFEAVMNARKSAGSMRCLRPILTYGILPFQRRDRIAQVVQESTRAAPWTSSKSGSVSDSEEGAMFDLGINYSFFRIVTPLEGGWVTVSSAFYFNRQLPS
jgi:hypothetical protein